VGEQPSADDSFGQPRTLFPGSRSGKVAKPRKAL
jgi:hypothetical protein